MGATGPSDWTAQPPKAVEVSAQSADWHPINSSGSIVQPRIQPQRLTCHDYAAPTYTAVQHDFERRLSRFGITISEAGNNPASNASNKPILLLRSRAGAHALLDGYNRDAVPRHDPEPSTTGEDFPPHELPTMACFTNNNNETKLEAVERKLRQAQTEAQIWKEKSEAQEHNLRAAYTETMEWRMKYEDLFSAVIQNQELQPKDWWKRHEGTKSLS